MTILQHTGISTALGIGLWWFSGPLAALACLIFGVLVDLDHFFDYMMNYTLRNFKMRHFYHVFRYEALKRVFVLLHAWEFAAAAWLCAWRFNWHPIWLGAAVGFGAHLLSDQIFNSHTPAAYLLTYRVIHGFSGRHFYGDHEIDRRRNQANHFAQKDNIT